MRQVETAEALEMLKRAIEAGYGNVDWATRDPDSACLHGDPEFLNCSRGPDTRGRRPGTRPA